LPAKTQHKKNNYKSQAQYVFNTFGIIHQHICTLPSYRPHYMSCSSVCLSVRLPQTRS